MAGRWRGTRGKKTTRRRQVDGKDTKGQGRTRKSRAGITRTASLIEMERHSEQWGASGVRGHTTVRVESTGIACYVGTCWLAEQVYTRQATDGAAGHRASGRPTGCWVVTSGARAAHSSKDWRGRRRGQRRRLASQS